MKKFVAIYQAPAEALAQSANATAQEKEAEMNQWFRWKNKNEEAVIDFGAPLMNGKAVDKTGTVLSSKKEVCGYSLLQDQSEAALRSRFSDHPHLNWHPQATIEIHEVLDM